MATTDLNTEVASFVDTLLADLRDKKVSILDGEFLAAVEKKSVSREQILAWAKSFYAATKNGRFGLGTYYANSPEDPELRRELAENLYEEETGRISGVNKCHMDVFFDFLAAFGVSEVEARGEPAPMGEHVPQGRAIAPEDFYVELATYGMCIETPNAEWSSRMDQALRENYGFTPQQTRWFSMHAELDADHGEEFRAYAIKAADVPSGLDRIREATLAMSPIIRDIWNGCGLWKDHT
jgi:pyrroloquinoline quinone (PQQ) biosynthesis protein C